MPTPEFSGRLYSVQLDADLYEATAGGQDSVELLRRLGERVVTVHVKDGPMRPGISARELPSDQCPAGQGDVPLAAVLTAEDLSIPYAVLEFDHYEVTSSTASPRPTPGCRRPGGLTRPACVKRAPTDAPSPRHAARGAGRGLFDADPQST